ncbi:MutT/NUDIX family protein [Treponema primitia ZAS-2]|uniref:8-oxo-dGTP diphosphatase n=1 Tax=Treponema primitia (strain ATCC BAA-887 / DSM 12427 / ZAS-2) TaxID=545694 RepID=F5YJR6_TREPZ|nr:(deoxy)nucleoside triphosphate pyrophosphohydrolase [Treponema primitia]AEF83739.1 MutT/NUDIX family protein [Treponema primitia ZAS-2]
MKHLEVVAGIIEFGGKILCLQKNVGKYDYISYKFEFPGGKVEPGESHCQALMRELNEELAMDIKIREQDFYMTVDHSYPDFEITLHSFLCRVNDCTFTLKEHKSFIWLKKMDLLRVEWAAADLPIVKKLMDDIV